MPAVLRQVPSSPYWSSGSCQRRQTLSIASHEPAPRLRQPPAVTRQLRHHIAAVRAKHLTRVIGGIVRCEKDGGRRDVAHPPESCQRPLCPLHRLPVLGNV